MIPGALAGVGVLAIDSAPLIYLVERHTTFGPPMEAMAALVDAGELQLVASP